MYWPVNCYNWNYGDSGGHGYDSDGNNYRWYDDGFGSGHCYDSNGNYYRGNRDGY